jgi:hypothetical protein
MPPPRASSADFAGSSQSPQQIAGVIEEFLAENSEAAVLEEGRVVFDLRTARHSLSIEHGRCSLHLWDEERNMLRTVVSATPRGKALRLGTRRLGTTQPKVMEIVRSGEHCAPGKRDAARTQYQRVLERVLAREFPDWKPDGFRTAMDLERSFGPAYTRGSLVRGNQAWAVIGVGAHETVPTIEGILTLGILWLDYCRERSAGRRTYKGLRVVLPRGTAALTLSRMAWLNPDAAQWELYELDERSEELTVCDLADRGNLRTRLVHHPEERAASERFEPAIERVLHLIPLSDRARVETRLRSTAELVFLLHGLEFARARISLAPGRFVHTLEITVGTGGAETPLTQSTHGELAARVAELFHRRRATPVSEAAGVVLRPPSRRIGSSETKAHSRLPSRGRAETGAGINPSQDPLYRAAPERWLESVLRQDLAPLTRRVAPEPMAVRGNLHDQFANDPDPDTRGNRIDHHSPANHVHETTEGQGHHSRVLPHLDSRHVYSQVPAIVGAGDRGLLDLLGVTADGRLAVLELKADDDLHFALQGLDYWIRVRHHHLETANSGSGLGEFQRHGYFRGVELSPLQPRLYLVAPALHIHPATETVLRYLSHSVEWQLLALDERWRNQIRVLWRKSSR